MTYTVSTLLTNPYVVDPLKLAAELWPHVTFYREQRQIINSLWYEADETYVPAANMMGKDYVAAFLCLAVFLSRHPCRVVTTSAKDDHLRVLWGEIGQFINSCRVPLDVKKGGPLIINHHDIRKVVRGQKCPLSYLLGMVAGPDSIAAMQGHHVARVGPRAPLHCCGLVEAVPLDRTMFMCDEASSVADDYMKMARTWANKILVIGNTWPCENFFKHAIEGKPGTDDPGGNILKERRTPSDIPQILQGDSYPQYYRRVIHIEAAASPNVRLGLAQEAAGQEPTDEVIIPGVKTYGEYRKNLQLWDEAQQCVSLFARFYKGKDALMFPPAWLERAMEIAAKWGRTTSGAPWGVGPTGKPRQAQGIGIDPAEGGDRTAMAAVDEYGVLEVISRKTPNTADITREALAFIQRHGLRDRPDCVGFDLGGGGKQHADRLKEDHGFPCRTVGFGAAVVPGPRRQVTPIAQRIDERGEQYAYLNRRAQMYGDLRELLDPSLNPEGFGIPREMYELRRQLGPIPIWYDKEGRLYLPPKNRKPDAKGAAAQQVTLNSLIGCSPDEADAVVIAIHMMLREEPRPFATGF